jgi:uncharacterized repeat protein (TIGR03803 family)
MKPASLMMAQMSALALGWISSWGTVQGQVTTILHNFGDGSSLPTGTAAGSDASSPGVALLQGKDGNFYGTTSDGGSSGHGTAFVMTPLGVVTILHNFGDSSVMNDGLTPNAALIQGTGSDTHFYGTTSTGGSQNMGTIFSMTPQGAITILHSFGDGSALNPDGTTATDGVSPTAALVLGKDGNFYGTTSAGGTNTTGTAFIMTPAGVVTILHHFGDGTVTSDGLNPNASLIQGNGSDTNFYGTTPSGGANNNLGTAFSMTPTGTVTILHNFGGSAVDTSGNSASDGSFPAAGLTWGSDGNFYGTTTDGGSGGTGTVFLMTTQGAVTILHSFIIGTDGTSPIGGLVQGSNGKFFGTTPLGGSHNAGVSFEVTTQGTETILHNFGDNTAINPDGSTATDGANPTAGLIQSSDGNFYGVTSGGGTGPGLNSSGLDGTVFKITVGTAGLNGTQSITGNLGYIITQALNTTGNPTSFAAVGLPAGLTIDPATGIISGIPTAVGSGSATITLTNAAGSNSVTVPFDIYNCVFAAASTIPANLVLNPAPVSSGPTPNQWTISASPSLDGLSFDSSTGTLSGTPVSPGVYTFTITASYTNPSLSQPQQRAVQNYTIIVPQTFAAWEAAKGITDAPSAKPRGDGVSTLLKYLCDIDPRVPMTAADRAALPTLGMTDAGYLTLTYRQFALKTGVTVNVQTSSDLINWTTLNPPALEQQIGSDVNTGDPIIEVGIKPVTSGNHYLRLNVTLP